MYKRQEYIIDGARLAKENGLFTNIVTNGSMSCEALDVLGPFLDVYRVDIKGFSEDTYFRIARLKNYREILDTVIVAKHKWRMHVEVVTNVIPGLNDDAGELASLARWIADNLDCNTPWHITRFYPAYKLSDSKPTAIAFLESVREKALSAGLRFVYLGNVYLHQAENTWCPGCGALLIERRGIWFKRSNIVSGRCPECGAKIPVVC